ncbi:cyclic lactone autoinducer peptide [Clostridium weizhouense]|uniref:Cyclic lactone autoinducer peptide n=1 Tax=Clostridium weizhouense TaxID=2859781 RepID=A0ABS7ASK1_9CLOT|nr:cyclic lactone autoinducer peptide [Clostridium weizhouense]MBW6411636.1 cyclic lactone autoinducer peptide [Clostridium weizhouense]
MRTMKKILFNKMSKKIAHSLGETSIRISEKAMNKSCFCGVYETKIPIELLKNSNQK